MNTLVAVNTEAAGENCAAGGFKLTVGVDTNQNGTLDTSEIGDTEYACNGANGSNGANGGDGWDGDAGTNGADGKKSLIGVTAEAKGSNCPAGGQKIETGVDENADNILQAEEVSATVYICNGQDGEDGQDGQPGLNSLVRVSQEDAGSNCPAAGYKIETGTDVDASGVLEQSEVTSTSYVCNGQAGAPGKNGDAGLNGTDGLNALIATATEAVGDNCAAGGVRILVGLDLNGDAILSTDEVTDTRYVCNADELFKFSASQSVKGRTVTCASVVRTSTYTECQELQVDGLYFPNGVTCGPEWSTEDSRFASLKDFCAFLSMRCMKPWSSAGAPDASCPA